MPAKDFNMPKVANSQSVNKAIKHLGLKAVKGRGYVYFLSLETGDQVGESVMVYAFNRMSVEQWVKEAEHAKK